MKNVNPLFAVLLLTGMISGCGEQLTEEHRSKLRQLDEMMTSADKEAANKKVAESLIRDVITGHKLELLDSMYTPDFKDHDEGNPTGDIAGSLAGIKMYQKAFPDLNQEVLQVVAEGDWVMLHFTNTGTNTDSLGPMPPNGKHITDIRGVDVFKFREGRIAEHWTYWDKEGFFKQMGLMPSE